MHAPQRVPILEALSDLLRIQRLLLRGCGQTATSWSGRSPLCLRIQSTQETGWSWAPERPASCKASGRPRKSQERRKDSEEGRQAWHGVRLWGARRPIFSLQFPPWCPFCRTQKGACTLKRIFEIMGFFCLFSFKINGSASGLLEKG